MQAHESIVTQASKVSEIYTTLAMEMTKPFHNTSVKDVVEVAAPLAAKSKAVA